MNILCQSERERRKFVCQKNAEKVFCGWLPYDEKNQIDDSSSLAKWSNSFGWDYNLIHWVPFIYYVSTFVALKLI